MIKIIYQLLFSVYVNSKMLLSCTDALFIIKLSCIWQANGSYENNENNLHAYGFMVSGEVCLFILDWSYQFRHPLGVIQLGDHFR